MKINSRYCLLTNDVETTSIWINRLRDETGERVLKEGMSHHISNIETPTLHIAIWKINQYHFNKGTRVLWKIVPAVILV